jgi:hypothetical protein
MEIRLFSGHDVSRDGNITAAALLLGKPRTFLTFYIDKFLMTLMI